MKHRTRCACCSAPFPPDARWQLTCDECTIEQEVMEEMYEEQEQHAAQEFTDYNNLGQENGKEKR